MLEWAPWDFGDTWWQPNDQDNTQDCVAIKGLSLRWHDKDCTELYPYICQSDVIKGTFFISICC